MGLFDVFRKKPEPEKEPEPKKEITESEDSDEAPGWDAIEQEFLRIYPGQTNPKHYAPMIKWIFGGPDPLDGISVYDGGDFWHFVTFGQTEIYQKECEDKEVSGYGYELTFKLKKADYEDEEAEIRCICGILQSIARITFKNGEIFRPYEYIYTGQTTGIDANRKSALTGFICVSDPSVNMIDTPNGKVSFLELIGMTDAELRTLSNRDSVMNIYEKLGGDITDYQRESLV